MAFIKGQSGNPAGRVAGTPNKYTGKVKEAFSEAFEMLGGAEALFKWAKNNETDFYKLASKLIPTDVNMAVKEMPQARVFPLGITDEHDRLPVASEAVDRIH